VVRELSAIFVAVPVLALTSCFTAHIARLPAGIDSEGDPRASIEECLTSLGMHDASQRYEGLYFAEREEFVAMWETPPVEYKSGFHRAFDVSPSHKFLSASISHSQGGWKIRFLRDDESIATQFASCMSSGHIGIPVELDSELYVDPS
jgi:hypothetical protein